MHASFNHTHSLTLTCTNSYAAVASGHHTILIALLCVPDTMNKHSTDEDENEKKNINMYSQVRPRLQPTQLNSLTWWKMVRIIVYFNREMCKWEATMRTMNLKKKKSEFRRSCCFFSLWPFRTTQYSFVKPKVLQFFIQTVNNNNIHNNIFAIVISFFSSMDVVQNKHSPAMKIHFEIIEFSNNNLVAFIQLVYGKLQFISFLYVQNIYVYNMVWGWYLIRVCVAYL